MKQFFLHVGLHKTATTLLQRTMSANRQKLAKSGIYYPNYNLIDQKKHYCHHDLAKSIANEGKFSPHQIKQFFLKAGKYNMGSCFISSEVFFRYSAHPTQGIDYIKRCAEYFNLTQTDVTVIICLREQASYIDSLYREHIEQTKYTGNIKRFIREREHWMNFKDRIDDWRTHFENVKIISYNTIDRSSYTNDFLHKALNCQVDLKDTRSSNPSLSDNWVLTKKIINELDVDLKTLKEFNAEIYKFMQNNIGTQKGPKRLLNTELSSNIFHRHKNCNESLARDANTQLDFSPFETSEEAITKSNPELLEIAVRKLNTML